MNDELHKLILALLGGVLMLAQGLLWRIYEIAKTQNKSEHEKLERMQERLESELNREREARHLIETEYVKHDHLDAQLERIDQHAKTTSETLVKLLERLSNIEGKMDSALKGNKTNS